MNIIYAILPVISLIAGFYMGFSIKKEDKLPEVKTPMEIVKEKQEERKQTKEQKEFETYMENIENYPHNQKDFK